MDSSGQASGASRKGGPNAGPDRAVHPGGASPRPARAQGLGPDGWWPPGAGNRRGPRRGPRRPPGVRPHGHGHGHGHGSGRRPSGEILFFAWTLDGTEPTSQEDVFGVAAATGAVRRLTDQSSGAPFVSDRDPAWSPDHGRIVLMSSDAVTSTHLPVLSSAGAPVAALAVEGSTPAWIDDTTVVCSLARLGPEGVFDRTDLVAVRVPDGLVTPLTGVLPGQHLSEPAWHSAAGLASTLTVQDPGTGESLCQRLVVAPSAAVMAVCAGGAPLTTTGLAEVAPGHGWPAGPAWSPDGTRLAFSAVRPCATTDTDGDRLLQMDVAVLTVGTGAVDWVTDDSTGDYDEGLNDGSPVFSPDGRWLAWARGHEDDWTAIMLQRLGTDLPPTTLLDGEHWFRWGLDW